MSEVPLSVVSKPASRACSQIPEPLGDLETFSRARGTSTPELSRAISSAEPFRETGFPETFFSPEFLTLTSGDPFFKLPPGLKLPPEKKLPAGLSKPT